MGIMQNSWPSLPEPTQPGQVGGHEGVGIVQKLGPGSSHSNIKLGDRVGIKVSLKLLELFLGLSINFSSG